MADQKITIEIDGKDNASPVIKKVGMSVTDLNSAMAIATRVYDVAAQAFKMTVNEAQAYDQQIRDVMLSTGATAEESSRLVQVVDDAGVSYGVLKTAMKNASKDGIEPNIASLQSLSDQYLKLAPGVERNQFLLDKFGKSGLEMARVMELGGSAIGKMNDEIGGSLVLTQQAIDESERYRKNVDDLQDSFQALKVTIGNELIPVTSDLIEHYQLVGESLKENGYWYTLTHQFSLEEIEDDKKRAAAMDGATTSYTAWAQAMEGEVTPAVEDNTAAIAEMTKANQANLDLIGELTNSLNDEATTLDEIKEKYGEGSQEFADATAEFELNSRRRILSMLEEQLSLDGLSQQESDILLAKGLAWGVYSEQAVAAARQAMLEVAALTEAINTIPSERTFTMSVLVQGADAVGGLGAGFGASQFSQPNQHAAGGSFMIPMAYGNEGFRMGNGDTASGGEMVTISPRGQGNGNADIIAAIERNRLNEDRLVQLLESAIQRSSR